MMELEGASSPRPAVAAVLRSSDGRILLAQRNPQLRFMGGCYAFPGGAIEKQDQDGREPVIERSRETDILALSRELFEETGLLVTVGTPPEQSALRTQRRALLDGVVSFNEVLKRHELVIDHMRFQPCGLFVTPETSVRRFHAKFYLIERVDPRQVELISGELVDFQWLTPQEARQRWLQKGFELAPPAASVLRQLSEFSLPTALERIRQLEPFTGDYAHCHEVRPGIHVMPLRSPTLLPARHTNCFIVGDRELCIIDPAAVDKHEQQRLIMLLEHACATNKANVRSILLTHGHRDHIGSATLLRQRFGVPICAHELTARQLDFPVDRRLSDGEIIDIPGDPGWQLECLHTPGHHPGHLCFLERTNGLLIAGDMIAGRSSIVIAHGRGGDMTDYLTSLQRLLSLDFDFMVPSHGTVINEPKRILERQIEHRHYRERRISSALDAGASSIEELLDRAYDDVSQKMRKYAEFTLRAHLARLGVAEFDA